MQRTSSEIAVYDKLGMKNNVKELCYSVRSAYQDVSIYNTELYGRCLFLDDVIQCSENDHEIYDKAILKKLKPTDKNLLILGGGDGYTAEMALKLNPGIKITLVELDGAVINTCKVYLEQKIFEHPNVNLVIGDAYHFMDQTGNVNYDCVICDLTDQPIGCSDIKLNDFFLSIFSRANKILNRTGWISAYVGCNEDIPSEIGSQFGRTEKCEVFISSFGEPCYFVHGSNLE